MKKYLECLQILHNENGETPEQVAQRTVDAPSLEMFKARLDGALSNPGEECPCNPLQGGCSQMVLEIPSNPTILFPSIGTSYRKCWTPALYINTRGLKLEIETFNEFIDFSVLSHHVSFSQVVGRNKESCIATIWSQNTNFLQVSCKYSFRELRGRRYSGVMALLPCRNWFKYKSTQVLSKDFISFNGLAKYLSTYQV